MSKPPYRPETARAAAPPAAASPRRSVGDRIATTLATSGGIGLAPKAPGTFGSLPGLAVGAGLHQAALRGAAALEAPAWAAPLAILGGLLALLLLAWWSIARTERLWNTHDDQRIVIDEVVGQAIAVGFFTPSWLTLVAGFALFRLFDITKPLAIGWIDREAPGALGTLFDDVLAGLVAALLLAGIVRFV